MIRDFEEYCGHVMDLVDPRVAENFEYFALGLFSEAGEVAGEIKKWQMTGDWDDEAIAKEMGDVLWYWVALCETLGYDPLKVMDLNIKKLEARREAGTIATRKVG